MLLYAIGMNYSFSCFLFLFFFLQALLKPDGSGLTKLTGAASLNEMLVCLCVGGCVFVWTSTKKEKKKDL